MLLDLPKAARSCRVRLELLGIGAVRFVRISCVLVLLFVGCVSVEYLLLGLLRCLDDVVGPLIGTPADAASEDEQRQCNPLGFRHYLFLEWNVEGKKPSSDCP